MKSIKGVTNIMDEIQRKIRELDEAHKRNMAGKQAKAHIEARHAATMPTKQEAEAYSAALRAQRDAQAEQTAYLVYQMQQLEEARKTEILDVEKLAKDHVERSKAAL